MPTYCAPNYGTFANSNGEPLGTQPNLSTTTIIPNTNPLVDINSPLDGAKYLPDAQVFADYACTETVYALSSCVATAPDGSQLDFSTNGQQDLHRHRDRRQRRQSPPRPSPTRSAPTSRRP